MAARNQQLSSNVRLQFLGAAGTVTGSCILVETSAGTFMVDCGLYQGGHEREQLSRMIYPPRQVDWLILTHAHIDHCGLLPWLCSRGFAGPIYATSGTRDLAQILLMDSARLQQEEASYHRRHGQRAVEPLYDEGQVVETMGRFVAIEYNWPFEPAPGIEVEFYDAGHILGAASVAVRVGDVQVVFSGDIGPRGRPLIRDPQPPAAGDVAVCEATYGNRLHPPISQAVGDLAAAVRRVIERGGVAIIPVFAVGRCQTIIYELGMLMREGELPSVPIFLDSPLAIEAMEVFRRHLQYFDEETLELIRQGIDPLRPAQLELCHTVDQSKALNELTEPAIILAGSGMCTGGRVRHHLRVRLGNERDGVIFVGYQAQGTLGRLLTDGVEKVKLYGEWVPVRAEIIPIHGFSAHADQQGLAGWLRGIQGLRRVLIDHAEPEAAEAYQEVVREQLGLAAEVVQLYGSYEVQ